MRRSNRISLQPSPALHQTLCTFFTLSFFSYFGMLCSGFDFCCCWCSERGRGGWPGRPDRRQQQLQLRPKEHQQPQVLVVKIILIVPGFRIRIHLIRIRIQHFRLNNDPDPNPIRIQGFYGQKLGKKYPQKKNLGG